jgi:peptidoglycan hydrolase CwlO-like protein
MKKLIFILLLAMATQLVFMSKGVVYGELMAGLDQKTKALEEENQELEAQLASLTAYSQIAREEPEKLFSLAKTTHSGLVVALR